MKETNMVNPLDKILSIKQRDRDVATSDFEARRNDTRRRFNHEMNRFDRLVREEVITHDVDPGLDIYEFDATRYLGVRLPHSPQHHFLILFTDEGYRLIENGAQCYIDEVEEDGNTIKVLRNPSIDDRIPFYQANDNVGSPSQGRPLPGSENQRYVATPPSLPAENQWHDSDVLTADIDPIIERQLSMMAEDLLQLSDEIENRQKLRAAGY